MEFLQYDFMQRALVAAVLVVRPVKLA